MLLHLMGAAAASAVAASSGEAEAETAPTARRWQLRL